MKAKKLNQNLFGTMELNSADMKTLKGGNATECVYSGSGRNASTGQMCDEYCCAFDDGSFVRIFSWV